MRTEDPLTRLHDWYSNQCNGEWEHQHGIVIETIDNPGWVLRVDLTGTELEFKQFLEVQNNYESETDWLICKKESEGGSEFFYGISGPRRLADLLEVFLDWAEK